MKSWLEKQNIEMYSTHNEGKSVFNEIFLEPQRTKQNLQTHDFNDKKCVY